MPKHLGKILLLSTLIGAAVYAFGSPSQEELDEAARAPVLVTAKVADNYMKLDHIIENQSVSNAVDSLSFIYDLSVASVDAYQKKVQNGNGNLPEDSSLDLRIAANVNYEMIAQTLVNHGPEVAQDSLKFIIGKTMNFLNNYKADVKWSYSSF